MVKSYKVNKEKNIGNVIFILEGSKTEFNVLETIFVKYLGYEMVKLKRGAGGYVFKGKNPYSKIIALNFQGNHLYEMNDEELNQLFYKMSSELGLKPEALPIYYIYDRDVKSYDESQVRDYVAKYSHPYDNADGSQGMLLLSYPAFESFIISCFGDDIYRTAIETGHELKRYMANEGVNQQMIRNDEEILKALEEIDKYIISKRLEAYDIDEFGKTSLEVYDSQQEFYVENGAFQLLSLFGVVLLDLGIVEEVVSA